MVLTRYLILSILQYHLQFAMVECVVTGLSDEYPKYLRRYKPFFLIGVCVLMFLLAIPMCAQVGTYLLLLCELKRSFWSPTCKPRIADVG